MCMYIVSEVSNVHVQNILPLNTKSCLDSYAQLSGPGHDKRSSLLRVNKVKRSSSAGGLNG